MLRHLISLTALAIAVVWPSAALMAQEPYTLQEGDVLGISVVGTEINVQMPIATDGTVAVPLAGTIVAAGRTLPEVSEEVRDKVARTPFPMFNDAGRPVAVQLPGSAVTLIIAEYRPVYVDGDVANPGAYPFRPGLTARQAVTLAGGYGLGQATIENPEFTAADLNGTLQSLNVRRTALLERIERLRDETGMTNADGTIAEAVALDTEERVDEATLAPPSEDVAFDERLAAIEAAGILARRNRLRSDKAYLDEASEWARLRLSMLRDQLTQETEVLSADQEEFQNLQGLRQSGVVTAGRLGDVRRALLFSSTRQLQTSAEISRTERELEELTYQVRRRNLDETTEAVNNLSAALVELGEVNAGIVATRQKLLHVGNERAILDRLGDVVDIEIVRKGESEPLSGPQVPLEPGDVVNVTIDFQRIYGG